MQVVYHLNLLNLPVKFIEPCNVVLQNPASSKQNYGTISQNY